MEYRNKEVSAAANALKKLFDKAENKRTILRASEMQALYDRLKTIPPGKARAAFGKEVNQLKSELEQMVREHAEPKDELTSIDVTAPFDINSPKPKFLPVTDGSIHPLMSELDKILNIFGRMGFSAIESRQLDDDYHMFTSLNFPKDHPARDEYDTFITDEGLVAPAHTSTMQNRVLKKHKKQLENNEPIAVVIPGRVFRNEDLDATHEHTFYQLEGVYVDRGINAGHLISTLKAFLEEYYGQELKVKTQPFYFPFTEPSFEFAIERPKSLRKDDSQAEEWLELLGCGMIHPNVLLEAGINPAIYTGFAWGGGIDRLVMMKYGIEDVRHFESGNLKFLRQFS